MANFYRARVRLSMVEYREQDFYNLCSVFENGEGSDFISSIQYGKNFWLDDDQDPNVDEMCGIIEIGIIFKEAELTDSIIAEFAEYFNDEYCVDIELSYCDEYENTECVGVFKDIHTVEFWETDENEEDYDEDEEHFDVNCSYSHYRPKDDKQRHEIFLMSWDGYRCIGHNEENFFNQLGIDDEYFYVKEADDFERLPDFHEWLNKSYTSLEKYNPKYF